MAACLLHGCARDICPGAARVQGPHVSGPLWAPRRPLCAVSTAWAQTPPAGFSSFPPGRAVFGVSVAVGDGRAPASHLQVYEAREGVFRRAKHTSLL